MDKKSGDDDEVSEMEEHRNKIVLDLNDVSHDKSLSLQFYNESSPFHEHKDSNF